MKSSSGIRSASRNRPGIARQNQLQPPAFYRSRRVLVTGGLGFIGSNLAIQLVAAGADVTVVDSCVPGCGWHSHNLDPVRDGIQFSSADIGDRTAMRGLIEGRE